MTDIKLSATQISHCKHMLGLDYTKMKMSFRNYYCAGHQQMPELDELVDQGIMTLRDAGEQMGGFYYHLNEAGIKLMKDIFGNFKEQ